MGRKIDLTGKTFGRLKVIKEHPERTSQGSIQWECECDCGNITIVSGDNLRRNHTLSCGCLQKESAQKRVVDLTGKTFGKLKVIKKIDNPLVKNRHSYWLCECECGTQNLIIDGENLKSGRTSSCGCLGRSKGEYIISQLLQSNGILFEREKTFNTCIFDSGKKARFDFYLPEYNLLIEFDGFQHYRFTGYEWNTEENYLKTIEHDNIKNQWCQENNIPLIRIPYTHINNIKIEDLLLNSRFLI